MRASGCVALVILPMLIVLIDLRMVIGYAQLADTMLCADESCSGTISQGEARLAYKPKDEKFLNLRKGDVVIVKSKNAGKKSHLWGGEVMGKDEFGFFPSSFIKELIVLVKTPSVGVSVKNFLEKRKSPAVEDPYAKLVASNQKITIDKSKKSGKDHEIMEDKKEESNVKNMEKENEDKTVEVKTIQNDKLVPENVNEKTESSMKKDEDKKPIEEMKHTEGEKKEDNPVKEENLDQDRMAEQKSNDKLPDAETDGMTSSDVVEQTPESLSEEKPLQEKKINGVDDYSKNEDLNDRQEDELQDSVDISKDIDTQKKEEDVDSKDVDETINEEKEKASSQESQEIDVKNSENAKEKENIVKKMPPDIAALLGEPIVSEEEGDALKEVESTQEQTKDEDPKIKDESLDSHTGIGTSGEDNSENDPAKSTNEDVHDDDQQKDGAGRGKREIQEEEDDMNKESPDIPGSVDTKHEDSQVNGAAELKQENHLNEMDKENSDKEELKSASEHPSTETHEDRVYESDGKTDENLAENDKVEKNPAAVPSDMHAQPQEELNADTESTVHGGKEEQDVDPGLNPKSVNDGSEKQNADETGDKDLNESARKDTNGKVESIQDDQVGRTNSEDEAPTDVRDEEENIVQEIIEEKIADDENINEEEDVKDGVDETQLAHKDSSEESGIQQDESHQNEKVESEGNIDQDANNKDERNTEHENSNEITKLPSDKSPDNVELHPDEKLADKMNSEDQEDTEDVKHQSDGENESTNKESSNDEKNGSEEPLTPKDVREEEVASRMHEKSPGDSSQEVEDNQITAGHEDELKEDGSQKQKLEESHNEKEKIESIEETLNIEGDKGKDGIEIPSTEKEQEKKTEETVETGGNSESLQQEVHDNKNETSGTNTGQINDVHQKEDEKEHVEEIEQVPDKEETEKEQPADSDAKKDNVEEKSEDERKEETGDYHEGEAEVMPHGEVEQSVESDMKEGDIGKKEEEPDNGKEEETGDNKVEDYNKEEIMHHGEVEKEETQENHEDMKEENKEIEKLEEGEKSGDRTSDDGKEDVLPTKQPIEGESTGETSDTKTDKGDMHDNTGMTNYGDDMLLKWFTGETYMSAPTSSIYNTEDQVSEPTQTEPGIDEDSNVLGTQQEKEIDDVSPDGFTDLCQDPLMKWFLPKFFFFSPAKSAAAAEKSNADDQLEDEEYSLEAENKDTFEGCVRDCYSDLLQDPLLKWFFTKVEKTTPREESEMNEEYDNLAITDLHFDSSLKWFLPKPILFTPADETNAEIQSNKFTEKENEQTSHSISDESNGFTDLMQDPLVKWYYVDGETKMTPSPQIRQETPMEDTIVYEGYEYNVKDKCVNLSEDPFLKRTMLPEANANTYIQDEGKDADSTSSADDNSYDIKGHPLLKYFLPGGCLQQSCESLVTPSLLKDLKESDINKIMYSHDDAELKLSDDKSAADGENMGIGCSNYIEDPVLKWIVLKTAKCLAQSHKKDDDNEDVVLPEASQHETDSSDVMGCSSLLNHPSLKWIVLKTAQCYEGANNQILDKDVELKEENINAEDGEAVHVEKDVELNENTSEEAIAEVAKKEDISETDNKICNYLSDPVLKWFTKKNSKCYVDQAKQNEYIGEEQKERDMNIEISDAPFQMENVRTNIWFVLRNLINSFRDRYEEITGFRVIITDIIQDLKILKKLKPQLTADFNIRGRKLRQEAITFEDTLLLHIQALTNKFYATEISNSDLKTIENTVIPRYKTILEEINTHLEELKQGMNNLHQEVLAETYGKSGDTKISDETIEEKKVEIAQDEILKLQEKLQELDEKLMQKDTESSSIVEKMMQESQLFKTRIVELENIIERKKEDESKREMSSEEKEKKFEEKLSALESALKKDDDERIKAAHTQVMEVKERLQEMESSIKMTAEAEKPFVERIKMLEEEILSRKNEEMDRTKTEKLEATRLHSKIQTLERQLRSRHHQENSKMLEEAKELQSKIKNLEQGLNEKAQKEKEESMLKESDTELKQRLDNLEEELKKQLQVKDSSEMEKETEDLKSRVFAMEEKLKNQADPPDVVLKESSENADKSKAVQDNDSSQKMSPDEILALLKTIFFQNDKMNEEITPEVTYRNQTDKVKTKFSENEMGIVNSELDLILQLSDSNNEEDKESKDETEGQGEKTSESYDALHEGKVVNWDESIETDSAKKKSLEWDEEIGGNDDNMVGEQAEEKTTDKTDTENETDKKEDAVQEKIPEINDNSSKTSDPTKIEDEVKPTNVTETERPPINEIIIGEETTPSSEEVPMEAEVSEKPIAAPEATEIQDKMQDNQAEIQHEVTETSVQSEEENEDKSNDTHSHQSEENTDDTIEDAAFDAPMEEEQDSVLSEETKENDDEMHVESLFLRLLFTLWRFPFDIVYILEPFFLLWLSLLPKEYQNDVHGVSWTVIVSTFFIGFFLIWIMVCRSRASSRKRKDEKAVGTITELRTQLETIIQDKLERENELKANQIELDMQREEMQKVSLENFNVGSEKTNLEHSLREYSSQNEVLQRELRMINHTLQEKDQAMQEVLSNSHQLEKSLTTQQEAITQYETSISQLQDAMKQADSEKRKMEESIKNFQERIKGLEKAKGDTKKEGKSWREQASKHSEKITDLEETLKTEREEAELKRQEIDVLKDCILQFKGAQEYLTEDGEDAESDNAIEKQKEKMKTMIDVANIKNVLRQTEAGKLQTTYELEAERTSRIETEGKVSELEATIQGDQAVKNKLEKEKQMLESKLQVMQEFYAKREVEIQSKLGMEQSRRESNASMLEEHQQQQMELVQQLDAYKKMGEEAKRRYEDSERQHKQEILGFEKKSHESWLACRDAERKVDEANKQMNQLHLELTDMQRRFRESQDREPLIRPRPERHGPPGAPPPFGPPRRGHASPLHFRKGPPSDIDRRSPPPLMRRPPSPGNSVNDNLRSQSPKGRPPSRPERPPSAHSLPPMDRRPPSGPQLGPGQSYPGPPPSQASRGRGFSPYRGGMPPQRQPMSRDFPRSRPPPGGSRGPMNSSPYMDRPPMMPSQSPRPPYSQNFTQASLHAPPPQMTGDSLHTEGLQPPPPGAMSPHDPPPPGTGQDMGGANPFRRAY